MDLPLRGSKQEKRLLFLLLSGVLMYTLGTLVLALITGFITHRHLVSDIDQRLLDAAYATEALLGPALHHRDMDANSLSDEQDYQIAMELTGLVRELELEYLYSMMEIDNRIMFITSSATPEEMATNTYEPAYFTEYPEADEALYRVIDEGGISYSEYTDRWGDFRSIFIPFTASDGQRYVIGADISLDAVTATTWQSVGIALLACLGFGLIGLPVIILYIRAIQRENRIRMARSYQCSLTGLPNRSRLLKDLKDVKIAHVGIINIDKFRHITTLYGPAVGDDILKQFAMRLNHIDPSPIDNYQPYRLYADEFAVLVKGHYEPALMEKKISYLYKQLTQQSYWAGEESIQLRIRMGAAADGEEAFTMADMALREARENNQSLVRYDNKQQLPLAYRRSYELTRQIREALDEHRFAVFYQPLLNTSSGDFEKYECLARMVDKDGEVIAYPCDFLPEAYRSRLYHRFSQMMLKAVFREMLRHNETVTVNLSISDIKRGSTMKLVFDHLSNPRTARRVEFEILENENIDDLNQVMNFINKVHHFGGRVGLDDLGKDYSNVDRLMTLPVDFVKIDGHIISKIADDKEAQDVARMIVSFAYKRKIQTVAEYCCDGKTSDTARRLGVDYLQGFHIGRPRRFDAASDDGQGFEEPPLRSNVF